MSRVSAGGARGPSGGRASARSMGAGRGGEPKRRLKVGQNSKLRGEHRTPVQGSQAASKCQAGLLAFLSSLLLAGFLLQASGKLLLLLLLLLLGEWPARLSRRPLVGSRAGFSLACARNLGHATP